MQELEAHEKAATDALRKEIQAAVNLSRRGQSVDLRTPEEKEAFLESILKRGRARLARGRQQRVA